LHDILSHLGESIDLHDALHLTEEPLDQAKVAVGDSRDGRHDVHVIEAVGREGEPQLLPLVLENELQLGT
jgi:hypothetical protein